MCRFVIASMMTWATLIMPIALSYLVLNNSVSGGLWIVPRMRMALGVLHLFLVLIQLSRLLVAIALRLRMDVLVMRLFTPAVLNVLPMVRANMPIVTWQRGRVIPTMFRVVLQNWYWAIRYIKTQMNSPPIWKITLRPKT